MIERGVRRRLRDEYRHEGFYPSRYVEVASWDSGARIIRLSRRSKKRFAAFAASSIGGWYDRKNGRARDLPCGPTRIFLEFEFRRVDCKVCCKVKRERLEFLAENSFYTQRFMYHVGRQCRRSTIQDVAKEHNLEWHTVKELEKEYMLEQLRLAGTARPKVIGIDEISIRKGHTYRIIVSDLERRIPIWFGGKDRPERV